LRTENKREYLSKAFKDFLKNEGIVNQLSVEYTPQQIGVAKRKNRTLVEMTKCIMLQDSFPQSLWTEIVELTRQHISEIKMRQGRWMEKCLLKHEQDANLMSVFLKSLDPKPSY